jgi:hypothetical protein
MDELLTDLRFTIRTLTKAPAFTLAAVAALTLGIGANTAIFSVVNAVLLKPVNAPEPDRIVTFMNTSPQGSGPGASPAKFMHWRRQADVVQDVSAYRSNIVNYTAGDVPEQLRAGQVSADFFRLFGVPTLHGRTFSDQEDRPNVGKTVVLVTACGCGDLAQTCRCWASRSRSAASRSRSSACLRRPSTWRFSTGSPSSSSRSNSIRTPAIRGTISASRDVSSRA